MLPRSRSCVLLRHRMNNYCPVCGGANTIPSVTRDDLIVMQNYVYRSQTDAVFSPTGYFELRVCGDCDFAYNAAFDPTLLTYDKNYDNLVPSAVIEEYYRQIAGFLNGTFDLTGGPVVEVGCGKGVFLTILARMFPGIEAFGMDPSYEPGAEAPPPNVKFIPEIFDRAHVPERPALVVCRHVLEHMSSPKEFLESIRNAAAAFPGTPFFIEVPDLEWIVDNDAFWDFCYEHCNYFTAGSLKNALHLSGFRPDNIRNEFRGQYLWSIGTISDGAITGTESHRTAERLAGYTLGENSLMNAVKEKVLGLKEAGETLIVWGMATKGVVFCNLIDPGNRLFDLCIDINGNKWGSFVPHTGHRIEMPAALANLSPDVRATVIVMNPNYLKEIVDSCTSFGVRASFIDAAGNKLALNE